MGRRLRLDQRLVELGLESSRSRARARILAGDVRLGDRVIDKAGTLVPADCEPRLRARPCYVSRGGEKLAGALDHFGIDPGGWRCADIGASTGGFSDCLLQRGARRVLALDVGHGQLADRLRRDPRVEVLERTHIRHYDRPPDAPRHDLVAADLAFIPVHRVLPSLVELARPGGQLLLLVKPQFGLERGAVSRSGVVRDPGLRAAAVQRVRETAAGLGLEVLGEADSVLAGPKGNLERFLWLRRPQMLRCVPAGRA